MLLYLPSSSVMAPVASCWLSLMSCEPSSLCRSHSREGERRDRRKKRNTSQLPTSPSDESHPYSHYFILTLLTFAVYANSVHGDFVHDDMAAIVTNEDTLGKTPVWDLLRNDFWGMDIRDRRSHKSYRPLTVFSLRLTHSTWGLQPLPYHLTNMALHAIITLLLHHTARSALGLTPQAALIASALFAVHPVHTEAVSGIVGRADLFSTLFFLLAFLLAQRNWENVWGVCCLAVLATLSKETGVMTIPVLVLYHLHQTREPWKCTSKAVIQYTAMTVVLVVCRLGLNGSPPVFSEQDNPAAFSPLPLTRLLTFPYLGVFGLWQLLCPSTLSYDWQLGSIPLLSSPWDGRNLLTLATLLTIPGLLQATRHSSSPALVFSLLTIVLPFLPASNLFFPVGFVSAERTLYTSSLGWCLLISLGTCRLLHHLRNHLHLRCFVWLLLLLSLMSSAARVVTRNSVWGSREELFRSGLSSTPGNGKVFYNYGNYLRDQERRQEARTCYKEALRLWPQYVIALNNLATVTENETDIEALLLRALEVDPGHVNSLFNLADLYRQQGHCSLAKSYFSLCLSSPDCLPEAHRLAQHCHLQGGQGQKQGPEQEYKHNQESRSRSMERSTRKGEERQERPQISQRDSGGLKTWEQCSNGSDPGSRCRG